MCESVWVGVTVGKLYILFFNTYGIIIIYGNNDMATGKKLTKRTIRDKVGKRSGKGDEAQTFNSGKYGEKRLRSSNRC